MTSPWPKQVVLCDVSPRDGLQNECKLVPTQQKISLGQGLLNASLPRIEVTSCASPKPIPRMDDAQDVMQCITRNPRVA